MSAQSGRLQHALKHLREQWDIAQDTWDDPASRDFEKNHIDPARTKHQERDRRHGKADGGPGKDPGSVQGRLTVRGRRPRACNRSRDSVTDRTRAWRATVLTTDHGIMPESPLVQKETVALTDLEALIADRAKRESETELGFRKRIEREEAEYKAAARQLAAKYKVDSESLEAQYCRARDEVVQTFQRDTQACKNEYAQTKKQIDEQFKKDQRRAKKAKEETGWQALAFFEGSREEGVKWRRAADANWHAALDDLHMKKETAEFVLKRCGKLAANLPEAVAPAPSETPAAPPSPPRPIPPHRPHRPRRPMPSRRPTSRKTRLRWAPFARSATRIDEELIALEALKLPKFLRIDVFIWPFLLLGGRRDRRPGLGHRVGWTPAAIVGVVAGGGRRDRGLYRPGRRWLAPAWRSTPCRCEGASPRPTNWSNRTRTGSRTSSKASSASSTRSGRRRCARPRRRWLAASPSSRAASKSRPRRPTRLPGQARADPPAPRRGAQEGRGTLSAPHRRPQGKIREGSARARRVVSADQGDHPAALRADLGQADQELDRGDGADQRDRWRGPRRGRAPIPGLDQAGARRLEAADRGPARHAFRRLRRRPRSVPQRRRRAIRGSSRCRPSSSCRPSCRFPFRARC